MAFPFVAGDVVDSWAHRARGGAPAARREGGEAGNPRHGRGGPGGTTTRGGPRRRQALLPGPQPHLDRTHRSSVVVLAGAGPSSRIAIRNDWDIGATGTSPVWPTRIADTGQQGPRVPRAPGRRRRPRVRAE